MWKSMLRSCSVAATVAAMVTASAGTATARPVFYTRAAIGAAAPAVSFTGTMGAFFYESKGGTKLTCRAGTVRAGEADGATTVREVKIRLTGCETSGFPCENAGANTIELDALRGEIGALSSKLPGLRLYSEAEGRGGEFAAFQCLSGAVAVRWRGSLIGSLAGAAGSTPAEGKFPASDGLTWAESKSLQKYTRFEGELTGEQLEQSEGGGEYEPLGISSIVKLVTSPAGALGYTL
jgi:hypothetical protein